MALRRATWVAAGAVAAALLGGSCECGRQEPRRGARAASGAGGRDLAQAGARRDPRTTAGGEEEAPSHGPAVALRPMGLDVPPASRFERVDPEEAAGHVRARGWARLEDLQAGRPDRMSLGNWLCRIWTHYGPPSEVQEDGFVYAFRDRETGDVITAYSAGSGPALGGRILDEDGLLMPGAQARVAQSVDAFVSLMDATVPRDCELEIDTPYGRTRIGVRHGEWFEEDLDPTP